MTLLGEFSGNPRDEMAILSPVARQGLATTATGLYRANMRRLDAVADTGALTTQVMTSTPIYLRKGDVVSNLTFRSGATPAGTPTNYWAALYSSDTTPALLGQSADQLTAAWAATTNKTFALASPVTIPSDGYYWAALMVKATTPPTLVGVSTTASSAIISGDLRLSQSSGSSLTTTAPATIATPSALATVPLVIAT